MSKKNKKPVETFWETLEKPEPKPKSKPKGKNGLPKKAKIAKVMHEFKEGELHSGSKRGPKVTYAKQAMAIALSEARRKGKKD